jgi:hypothetical protein
MDELTITRIQFANIELPTVGLRNIEILNFELPNADNWTLITERWITERWVNECWKSAGKIPILINLDSTYLLVLLELFLQSHVQFFFSII